MEISDLVIGFGLLLPIFLLSMIFSFIFYAKLVNNKNIITNNQEIIFFEIDLKNWRIRRKIITFSWRNKNSEKSFVKKDGIDFSNGWIDLSRFIKILPENEQKKWKKSIEYCVQNKMIATFDSNIQQNDSSVWNITFNYVNSQKINVYAKSNTKNIEYKIKNKIITKKKLLENQFTYKIFAAFGLVDSEKETIQTFIEEFDRLLNVKNILYFQSSNVIIISYGSEKYRKLQWFKNKVLKTIQKIKNKSMIENYYDSIAFVEAKDLTTENEFSKVMTRISFGLTKSKLTFEPFTFNLKSIFYNEFEEYKESVMTINDLFKYKKVEINKISVKKVSNDKKVYTYLFPKINLNNSVWVNCLSQSENFNHKIKSSFFKKVFDSSEKDLNNIIIDINVDNIEEIFDKMTNWKNATYIIEINKNFNVIKLISLLNLLNKYNISFGFKIKELNSDLLSVIENTKPKMLILNIDMGNEINDNIKEKLLKIEIITMCERFQIIPIFENLNDKSKEKIKAIGKKEKYYYNIANII